MTEKIEKIYADANIAIEYAKYMRRLHKQERENDLWFFGQMLRAVEAGVLEVYTSSISVAECTHIKDERDPSNHVTICDQDLQEFLSRLLTSGTLIKLVQDSIFVAERARDLFWKDGIKLAGMDAIHVASALDADCSEFLSWDTDISKVATSMKIAALRKKQLRVILPHESQLLPGEFKQGNLLSAGAPKERLRLHGETITPITPQAENPAGLPGDGASGSGNKAGAAQEESHTKKA